MISREGGKAMTEADPHRVNPAEHRGRDVGLLAKLFKLKRHRRDDDISGPRRIHPDEGEEEE